MEKEEHIRQLFSKFLARTCTEEELKTLLNHIRTEEGEKQWNTLLDELWNQEAESEITGCYQPQEKEELFYQLMSRAREGSQRRISARQVELKPAQRPSIRTGPAWYQLAATFLLLALVVFAIARWQTKDSTLAMIEKATQAGQKATVSLSDGTKVKLNSLSKLTYPQSFTGDLREVVLEGEAFFEVTSVVTGRVTS